MSTKHDPRSYLEDVLVSIDYIESYAQGVTLLGFMGNPMVQDAVIRRIEIIGEAVGRLPE